MGRTIRRMGRFAPSQRGQAVQIPCNQRLFLCTRPALYLALGLNRVGDAFELLRKYQRDGTTRGCVAAIGTGVVLCDPYFKFMACGADVIAAVDTPQNVQIRASHGAVLVLRDAPTRNLSGGTKRIRRSSG